MTVEKRAGMRPAARCGTGIRRGCNPCSCMPVRYCGTSHRYHGTVRRYAGIYQLPISAPKSLTTLSITKHLWKTSRQNGDSESNALQYYSPLDDTWLRPVAFQHSASFRASRSQAIAMSLSKIKHIVLVSCPSPRRSSRKPSRLPSTRRC